MTKKFPFFLAIFILIGFETMPVCAIDKPAKKKNVFNMAAAMNNKATRMMLENKYEQAIEIYRDLVADYPDYALGASNLSIALFNKAADLQKKDNKEWQMIDLLEEALFWNPKDQKALSGLNDLIENVNLNPKSYSDRLDLAERAKERGNKRAALTELRQAFVLNKSKDTEKEIKELEEALTAKHVVHFSVKGKLEDVDCADYMENVQRRLKSAWDPPVMQRTSSVMAFFQIFPNGKYRLIKVARPSSSKEYNAAALKALNTVEWFRESPVGINVEMDIEFTFDYRVYSKNTLVPHAQTALERKFVNVFDQAKSLYRQKSFSKAIEKYKEAIALNIEDHQVLCENHLSDCYYQLAKQQLDLDPNSAAKNFRECLILAPDYDRAQEGLDKAFAKVSINPKSIQEREKLVDDLVAQKNFNHALVDCKLLVKMASREDKERITKRVLQIQKIDRSLKSKSVWETYLQKNPNSIEARIALAHCFVDLGEKPQAIDLLNDILIRSPQNAQAKSLLKNLETK